MSAESGALRVLSCRVLSVGESRGQGRTEKKGRVHVSVESGALAVLSCRVCSAQSLSCGVLRVGGGGSTCGVEQAVDVVHVNVSDCLRAPSRRGPGGLTCMRPSPARSSAGGPAQAHPLIPLLAHPVHVLLLLLLLLMLVLSILQAHALLHA